MHFNNDADLYRIIGTNIKYYREQKNLTQTLVLCQDLVQVKMRFSSS